MTRHLAIMAVLVTLGVSACRSQIQLGDPDAANGVPSPSGTVPQAPRCSGVASRSVVTVAEASWGELRRIVTGGGMLYALFSNPNTNEGVVARVPTSGGTLTELAKVGIDPVALASSRDGAFVFVSARGSSQVIRADQSGGVVVAAAGGVPAGIVGDDRAGAFWALPADDSVASWSFDAGNPGRVATTPRANALLRIASVLYIVGDRSISVFDTAQDAAPRKLADRCNGSAPAVDGQSLYCADAGDIVQVDLATGNATVVAAAQPGATDVVAAAGRLFWRAAQSPQQTVVMALPLDRIGGPTVFEGLAPAAGALLVAAEGCNLYFNSGRSIISRGL